MADDLIILTRTYDLLAWLLPKSERFPKVYRATVIHRLMSAAAHKNDLHPAKKQGIVLSLSEIVCTYHA